MKYLFEKTTIKNMSLKNRFVRSATWEGLANADGHINDDIIKIYEDLAKGNIGLIITSYAHIVSEEQSNKNMLGIYDDSFIDDYKMLVDKVHSYGSKIMMQIVYGGSNTGYNTEDRLILGPSSVKHLTRGVTPKEMTKDDIDYVINAFADAALRVKTAGFDGVQIHGAHGYLLSQFLDPYHNRRNDEYGGCIENRSRLIFEVYEAIREKVGEDFHIGIKINCSDFRENGATFEDCRYVVENLDNMGIDSVEVSGSDFKSFKGESFFKEYADELAKKIKASIMLVGGNKTFNNMTEVLNNTDIEYFSICRPLICEPDLINKFKEDNLYKPRCIKCDKCLTNNKLCILHK